MYCIHACVHACVCVCVCITYCPCLGVHVWLYLYVCILQTWPSFSAVYVLSSSLSYWSKIKLCVCVCVCACVRACVMCVSACMWYVCVCVCYSSTPIWMPDRQVGVSRWQPGVHQHHTGLWRKDWLPRGTWREPYLQWVFAPSLQPLQSRYRCRHCHCVENFWQTF